VDHDVAGVFSSPSASAPVLEQLLGVLLLERLAGTVGLLRVTDVGERDVAAQIAQRAASASASLSLSVSS